jgi:hypothetical protein
VYIRGRITKSECADRIDLKDIKGERDMRARNFVLALAMCFVGAALCFADNPNMGTWKLDEAKSHIPAGFMKNTTVVYSADGDNVKVTTDGTDRNGKPMHTEWTGKFDGKDYPLSGDPTADSRSYRKMNERVLLLANKKDGKTTTSGRINVSADGKTRTLKVSGMDASGKKVSSEAVYEKQ